jgi:hypothetical protein
MDGPLRRPTDSSLRSGTPSLGEVPSGGARAFCLLLRFSKVSRCKSGTISSHDRRNGYVLGPIQHPGRPRGRHRGQPPLPHLDRDRLNILIGPEAVIGGKPPPTFGPGSTHWSAPRPPSGASPLPQFDRREPGKYPSAKTTKPRRNGALSLVAAPITSWRQVQQVRQPLQPWLGP